MGGLGAATAENKRSQRGAIIDSGRILYLRRQRLAGALLRRWQSGQVAEGRIKIRQRCRLPGLLPVLGNAGDVNEQRSARGLFPERELFPVLLFANVKAVVRPQDDDRALRHGRGVEPVEETAKLVVHVTDGSEVAAHEMLPLFVVGHPLVPALAAVTMGVGKIIREMDRKLDFGFGIEIEPLLRNFPGNVRTKQPHRQEQRLVDGFCHLLDGPVHNRAIALVGVQFDWRSAEVVIVQRTASDETLVLIRLRTLRSRPICRDRIQRIAPILVPGVRIVLRITGRPLQRVKDLPAADCPIPVIPEVLRQHNGLFQHRRFVPPARTVRAEQIPIDSRLHRMHTGHHRNPRRVASGSGAVGVGKGDRSFREPVKVRRLDSGMIVQRRDIVVQIIDRDEQDVRPRGCLG